MKIPKPIFNFVPKKVLHPAITFTRNTSATVIDKNGKIKLLGQNIPRYEYDPITYENKGLLIEEARTNLLTYSEDFSNASWATGKTVTVSTNSTISPDGLTTADTLEDTSNSVTQNIMQDLSITSGTIQRCGSVYLKQGTSRYCNLDVLHLNGTQVLSRVFVDLQNGTLSGIFRTNSNDSYGIVNVGNGWFRVWATSTDNSSGNTICRILIAPSTLSSGFDNSLTGNVYIWGAQLEAGAFPTSYISTTSSTVLRNADICTLQLSSLIGPHGESLWNGNEGTLLVKSVAPQALSTLYPAICNLDDGTLNNRITINRNPVGNMQLWVYNGGTYYTPITIGSINNGINFSLSISWSGNTFYTTMSEVNNTANYAGSPSGLSTMRIGGLISTTFWNGHIKQITLWNRRLDNSTLQELTR